jgi:outer membrane protein assembly factor BamB
VYDGDIYVGAGTGVFYKLSEATGEIEAQTFLGFTQRATCGARGITATATVDFDDELGETVVYVAGGDGYVYALEASELNTIWSAPANVQAPGVNDYYNWASPLVANGLVYQGVSSQCDAPLVRGGLIAFDQHTGQQVATYSTVPEGSVGGSIWSSAAATADGSTVFVTTGNSDPNEFPPLGDSFSIVALDAHTLVKKDIWTMHLKRFRDLDFGGSPTLFTAVINGKRRAMVGAVNKTGFYRAWRIGKLSKGPLWKYRVGVDHDIAAAAWDGRHLFIASTQTKINAMPYNGSIRGFDPSTGARIWETGLPGIVYGSPTLDGAGVLGVATYDLSGAPNAAYLVDATDGSILATLSTNNSVSFAQVVFADGFVFVTAQAHHLLAYAPEHD